MNSIPRFTRIAREKHGMSLREYYRHNNLLRCYGIGLPEYEVLHSEQGGICAICGRPETKIDPTTGEIAWLSVDHDHSTGKVRGLLCAACNSALGLLQDDTGRMFAMISYLKRSRPGWVQERMAGV